MIYEGNVDYQSVRASWSVSHVLSVKKLGRFVPTERDSLVHVVQVKFANYHNHSRSAAIYYFE